MDLSRPTFGEWFAAAAGLVFLLAMLVSWYETDLVPVDLAGGAEVTGIGTGISGWGSFGFPLDVLLFLAACAPIAQVALRAAHAMPELPTSPATIVTAAGAFAALLVLYRLIDRPGAGDTSVQLGLPIALLAALGIAFGGYTAAAERAAGTTRRRRVPG